MTAAGLLALVCLLSVLMPAARVAALSPPLEPEDVAATAPIALVGAVDDVSAARRGDGTIYTTVRIDVREVVKEPAPGTVGGTVEVEVFGGTVGDESMGMEDTPVFVEGEEVIVLLEGSASPFRVAAGFQGKFEVKDDRVFGAGRSFGAKADFLQRIQ
jgi:hypothetical protein